MKAMDQRMEQMMQGFGGSIFGGKDPFADPFFSRAGGGMFERADRMMEDMRKQMMDMPSAGQIG